MDKYVYQLKALPIDTRKISILLHMTVISNGSVKYKVTNAWRFHAPRLNASGECFSPLQKEEILINFVNTSTCKKALRN